MTPSSSAPSPSPVPASPSPSPSSRPTHGLVYPPQFLNSLPVVGVARPAPHASVRALSAGQYAELVHAHSLADPDDSVLFPFLHGVEGDNQAQNSFFASASGASRGRGVQHLGPPDIPRYRGLTTILCDDEDEEERLSDSESDDDDDAWYDQSDSDSDSAEPHEDDRDETMRMADINIADPNASAPASYRESFAPIDTSAKVDTVSNDVIAVRSSRADSLSDIPSPVSVASSSLESTSTAPTSVVVPSQKSIKHKKRRSRARLHTGARRCLIQSAMSPHEILTEEEPAEFVKPRVPDGISLRNFGIQVPTYAAISDIVVYSPRGATRAATELARRIKLAVERKAEERWVRMRSANKITNEEEGPGTEGEIGYGTGLLAYNVFVVTDSFDVFERQYPHLVAVNTKARDVNRIDFFAREKEEMRELTKASEIADGLWLGNTQDVPMPPMYAHDPNAWPTPYPDPFDSTGNPDGYDICIECHEQAGFCTPAQLHQAEQHLVNLDACWEERVRGITGTGDNGAFGVFGASPSSTPIPPRPAPNPSSVIHMSFPASPPSTQATLAQLLPFIAFLQRVVHAHPRPAKVLIHSGDGYTESSVLALCYIMLERQISLPEAYLELQCTRNRSFFVYPSDVGALRRVEARLGVEGRSDREEGSAAGRWRWGSVGAWRSGSLSSSSSSNGIFGRERSSSRGSTPDVPSLAPSSANQRKTRARASTSPLLPAIVDHQTWFNDSRFDGSFPSRVLPFLYLGNLAHAGNVHMLHALGITHVVSVGECALVPGQVGGLWTEEREGRISVLDIKGVCDDGIDSLRTEIGPVVEWIDKARESGGSVLVHCRVGVSRSATITIAYVMKHLGVGLVDAYLMVRSRRLSVLIQPNMRLLYNLCGWEIQLAKERAPDGIVPPGKGRQLTWPFLAREVASLNERYLS
ncbi:dual specificity protein phosphatase PPS1 [Rhizoctonia solani 123E]|uniref:Dual specificity protein phosphatase PPS1 n=1 Tax=Rhizoctonia solani 123E TaxID=1423351 RepID=A0A074SCQ2_9AGAM|nr:dual specificity protein phosphatase PPS1 [Rhizoctonia solani 123E]